MNINDLSNESEEVIAEKARKRKIIILYITFAIGFMTFVILFAFSDDKAQTFEDTWDITGVLLEIVGWVLSIFG